MGEFQVMAGNDLRSGRVVYLSGGGSWTHVFAQASRLFDQADLLVAEEQASKSVDADFIVDPYLVQVVATGGKPSHIREQIRQSGPTCLPTFSADFQVAG